MPLYNPFRPSNVPDHWSGKKIDYLSCIFFHPSLLKCRPPPHLGHRQWDHSPGPKKSGPTISAKCGSGRHSILQHRGFIPTTGRRCPSGGQMAHRKKYRAARRWICHRKRSSPYPTSTWFRSSCRPCVYSGLIELAAKIDFTELSFDGFGISFIEYQHVLVRFSEFSISRKLLSDPDRQRTHRRY